MNRPIEKCNRCVVDVACQNQIESECLPVPAFGDVSSSSIKVATIGLNPALDEYQWNKVRKERGQRLAMLNDYNATNRPDLQDADIHDSKTRRDGYFKDANRGWHSYFEKLECLVSRIQPAWSYFSGRVVHIDLVACATGVRWGNLEANCQTTLLKNCHEYFLTTLACLPSGTLLLFDGARIVNEMRQLGLPFEQGGENQLINLRGNRGCIGKLVLGEKTFPFRGWSMPVGKLTPVLRYDLAFWICGTLNPPQRFLPST